MGLISRVSSRTYRFIMPTYDKYKIFETDDVLAILDALPVSKGHSLLIPKNCEETSVETMSPEAAAKLFSELPRLCKIVKEATGCDALNVVSNLGKEAGQVVFHPHIHVMPRTTDDKLIKLPSAYKGMIDKEEALKLLEAMKNEKQE